MLFIRFALPKLKLKMLVNVKTISNSRIAIPDWKVKKCVKAHEDLDIRYQGKQMIIKLSEINNKVLAVSDETYPDRYGMNNGKEYRLYFFSWKPMSEEDITKKIYFGYQKIMKYRNSKWEKIKKLLDKKDEKGFPKYTIRQIAEKFGITTQAIYSHIKKNQRSLNK